MRADTAILYLGKIMIFRVRRIACHIESGIMIFVYVCAAGEIVQSFEGTVEQNGEIAFKAVGSDIAGFQPAFFGNHCWMDITTQMVCEFGFIDFEVAADE